MSQDRPDPSKYNRSGVYSISALGHILYVGKSVNMRNRIYQHMSHIKKPEGSEDSRGINKYFVLNDFYNNGITISFDVLYTGKDIDYMEAYYINKYKPILNMKIPQINNPDNCLINELAPVVTFEDVLGGMWQFEETEGINFEESGLPAS